MNHFRRFAPDRQGETAAGFGKWSAGVLSAIEYLGHVQIGMSIWTMCSSIRFR
ncbi:MAG: hypothetical protein Q4A16_04015 [Lautropia sp.]|nr:hypothetical protein [Lautropia sp.]